MRYRVIKEFKTRTRHHKPGAEVGVSDLDHALEPSVLEERGFVEAIPEAGPSQE